jgi:hypothetical protein
MPDACGIGGVSASAADSARRESGRKKETELGWARHTVH